MKKLRFERILSVLLCACLLTAVLPGGIRAEQEAVFPEPLPFADVSEDAWYYGDVLAAYSMGLVNGKSAAVFAPDDGILLSEAVKLAACMHERYETGTVTLQNGEDGPWYEPYAVYAWEHGILTGDADFDTPALRGEVMELFARAVPLEPVNEIPDGAIPDVPMEHPHAEAVYALYRAGVVQGMNETDRRCEPDVGVTRAEIAATLTRMTDPSARIAFSMTGSGDEEDIPEPEREPDETGSSPLSEEYPGRTWSGLALSWSAVYDGRFGSGASDEILLTDAGIDAYNASMTAACPTMTDLTSYPDEIPGWEAAALIGRYVLPTGYDYDKNGAYIDEYRRAMILSNRNLGALGESAEAVRAVVTARCDLRGFPTEDGFCPLGNPGFDQIQETELIVGTPVIVLHTSADGLWYFALTYHYAGWIPVWAAAFCDRDTFDRFALRDPGTGVTVTAAVVWSGGVRLDMGVWLPYLGETGRGLEAVLPLRGSDGRYAETAVSLGPDEAVRGRLPYTMKNFYEQAFRWLGTPYGWGGADGGVDCSGFVCAVMRSFGILIPRNTTEQRSWSGEVTDISWRGGSERLSLFASSRYPVAIHRQGHVMLYLGESDGQLWIVHAHSIGQPVSVAPLDPSSSMLVMAELRP